MRESIPVRLSLIPAAEDFQILDILMEEGRISPGVLRSLHLPGQIDNEKGVVINGRAPIWLYAYLIGLCRSVPWIATFNPMDGAVVTVARSSKGRSVGDVIEPDRILQYLRPHLQPPKQAKSAQPAAGSFAVAFLGPPHSGKSVLMNAMRMALQKKMTPVSFERYFFVLRACPDGEGDWFSRIPQDMGLILRYKAPFDDGFVDRICAAVQRLRRQKRLLFVDCGGKIDRKNQRILNLCTHAIIVSRDPEQTGWWYGAALASELEVLAEIESTLENTSEIVQQGQPLRVRLGPLQRGSETEIPVPQELIGLVINLLGRDH